MVCVVLEWNLSGIGVVLVFGVVFWWSRSGVVFFGVVCFGFLLYFMVCCGVFVVVKRYWSGIKVAFRH